MKDNVKCCNCDFVGLVETGADKCPKCGYIGALSWVEGQAQEVPNGWTPPAAPSIEKNWGEDPRRAPDLSEGDKLIFSECGRALPSVGGRPGEKIDYRSHFLRVVLGKYGGYRLLVKHGGGQEEFPLCYEHRGLIPVLATLPSDSLYIALYALYDVWKESKYKAEQATRAEMRDAFLQGRMKSRKCKRVIKFWIEPKAEEKQS